jgi:hypothetical protein
MMPLSLLKYFEVVVLFSMTKKRSHPSTRALFRLQARRSFHEGD